MTPEERAALIKKIQSGSLSEDDMEALLYGIRYGHFFTAQTIYLRFDQAIIQVEELRQALAALRIIKTSDLYQQGVWPGPLTETDLQRWVDQNIDLLEGLVEGIDRHLAGQAV